jgi:hypothetical protein
MALLLLLIALVLGLPDICGWLFGQRRRSLFYLRGAERACVGALVFFSCVSHRCSIVAMYYDSRSEAYPALAATDGKSPSLQNPYGRKDRRDPDAR